MKVISQAQDDNNWNVCGHKQVIDFLRGSINSNNVSNAYIFSGLERLGKTTVANKFVSSLLCHNALGGDYCGDCSDCRQFENKVHPDVYWLDKINNEKTGKLNKNITVKQIRELKNRLQQATLLSGYKIAIINNAQSLNISGFNALLKILEEPSSNTVIIMITNNIDILPSTIVSRCQVLNFLPVAGSKIEKFLGDSEQNYLISKLAHGRPGLAVSFQNNPEELHNYQLRIGQFLQLISVGISDRFDLVNDLIIWSTDEFLNINRLNRLLEDWQLIVRDLILIQNNNQTFISGVGFMQKMKEVSSRVSFYRLKSFLFQIQKAKNLLQNNINLKFLIENLIINL